ncbi:MAG: hypothetical protein H0V17_26320 [Deltaproteobacteria bacterium]|nr:hypothetical protein [Deltaproteobacteria bacterium]
MVTDKVGRVIGVIGVAAVEDALDAFDALDAIDTIDLIEDDDATQTPPRDPSHVEPRAIAVRPPVVSRLDVSTPIVRVFANMGPRSVTP